MTWRVWQALKHPAYQHPVFKRIATYESAFNGASALQGVLMQGQVWLWSLVFVVHMRALVLMAFSGTLYGVMVALVISNAIDTEQRSSTYDLLCVSPCGSLGILWAICTGCLHRSQAFSQINSQETWSVRIILLIPLVISAQSFLGPRFTMPSAVAAWIVAAGFVFYCDHVQSLVIGSLLGTLTQQYTPSRLDNRLCASAGFLGVQMLTYFLMIGIIALLPMLYRTAGINGWYADASVPLTAAATFYASREYIVSRLWRLFAAQLNADTTGAEQVFSPIAYREILFRAYDDRQTVAGAQ